MLLCAQGGLIILEGGLGWDAKLTREPEDNSSAQPANRRGLIGERRGLVGERRGSLRTLNIPKRSVRARL